MAKNYFYYSIDNNIKKKIKKAYIGDVNNKPKVIKKIYQKINNTNTLVYEHLYYSLTIKITKDNYNFASGNAQFSITFPGDSEVINITDYDCQGNGAYSYFEKTYEFNKLIETNPKIFISATAQRDTFLNDGYLAIDNYITGKSSSGYYEVADSFEFLPNKKILIEDENFNESRGAHFKISIIEE